MSYSPVFRMAKGHEESIQAISQNLANSSTPGYRQVQVSHRVFDSMLGDAVTPRMDGEDGTYFDPMTVNFTEGALHPTDRPLDFAVRGKGFFAVSKDGRELYTRKGDFHLDADGNLLTADKCVVQGTSGPIRIPADVALNELVVSEEGILQGKLPSGVQEFGKLKIVAFNDPKQLFQVGTTLYGAPSEMPPVDAGAETLVCNRTLEQSNTSIFEELAELILTVRSYEACKKMIQNDDEKTGKMIQQMSLS